METQRMTRLLQGTRILAIEQYGAGPYGTQLLAELGAEVIKIEAPSMGGDVSRLVGPFFLGENDSEFFQTFSRSKKSVSIELKSKDGRKAFERLVATSDAVVNNVRGDQPAKMRITYADLKSIKPAIVCAHLSAYGRDNSRAAWPGYDYLMQAEAGFMKLTGEPDGPPTRFGLSMVDFMTGSVFALGIVSAILHGRATGEGTDVDVSLFDVALHQLSYPATWAMNEDYDVGRLPRGAHPAIAPSQLVKTRDGWGFICCQTQKFWEILCERVERPELKARSEFLTVALRRENLSALTEVLDRIFQTRTTNEWQDVLAGLVPFAPVRDIRTALASPFVREIGMRDVVAHPAKPQGLHLLACPIKVNGQRMPGMRAPRLGEHTQDYLKDG